MIVWKGSVSQMCPHVQCPSFLLTIEAKRRAVGKGSSTFEFLGEIVK